METILILYPISSSVSAELVDTLQGIMLSEGERRAHLRTTPCWITLSRDATAMTREGGSRLHLVYPSQSYFGQLYLHLVEYSIR